MVVEFSCRGTTVQLICKHAYAGKFWLQPCSTHQGNGGEAPARLPVLRLSKTEPLSTLGPLVTLSCSRPRQTETKSFMHLSGDRANAAVQFT